MGSLQDIGIILLYIETSYIDELGYFYFVDRIGDTFRWKGENVATSEVSEILTQYPGIEEANVYGVKVEGCDGRAGMAALVINSDFQITKLSNFVKEKLPYYAQPLFIRIQNHLNTTGTFKIKKNDLVKEGFNPQTIEDKLYFFDPHQKIYTTLDEKTYKSIQEKEIKI
jgi:fatty-acyl-CoA synthase